MTVPDHKLALQLLSLMADAGVVPGQRLLVSELLGRWRLRGLRLDQIDRAIRRAVDQGLVVEHATDWGPVLELRATLEPSISPMAWLGQLFRDRRFKAVAGSAAGSLSH